VLAAITGVFVDRDPHGARPAVQPRLSSAQPLRYRTAPASIKALMAGLPKDFKYERGFVAAEGDLVMIHGRYNGLGDPSRWSRSTSSELLTARSSSTGDVLQEEVPAAQSANGNGMF